MPVVIGADGTAIDTDAAGAQSASMANGHVASAPEAQALRREADLTQRYGTGLGQVEGVLGPLLAGGARGLTFGLSDVALSELGGEDVRARLRDYNDFNSIEGSAGEMGGMAAGALLGGGLGAVGRGVEALGARALGEGLAARTLTGAAAGAVENGLYSAGRAAGDAAIRDEAITGEKLAAAGLDGAIFGGAVGGGLGFLGGASERILSRERPITSGSLADSVPTTKGSIGEYLSKQSDVNTIKALGGSAGDIRNIERNVKGGYRRVAQDINADIEATTGKSIGFHDKESLHEYATKRLEEVNKTQADLIKQLDDAKTGLAPKPTEFAKRATDELISPHIIAGPEGAAILPGQEKAVNAVGGWVKRVEDAFANREPTFAEWRKMRIGLDNEIKYHQVNVTPETAALKQLRGIMEDEFAGAGERASQSMGSTFRDQYQANKQLTQSLIKAEELTNRGVSRELVNNSFGLRASMGAIAGFAAGNPIAGIAAGLAGKLVKDRGDFLAADLMRRASTLSGVNRLVNGVTEGIQTGVRKLIPASSDVTTGRAVDAARIGGGALGVKLTGNQRADFNKIASQITQASVSPERTADRVSKTLGPLASQAPKTAAAVVSTTMAAMDYLSKLLPTMRNDPYSLQPQFEDRRPSDLEIAQYMRAAQAIDDPLIVLKEAKAGKLSRDHVEAVKAVYPGLYEEIRASVFDHLVNSKKKLPYSARIQMNVLLDLPTDRTLSPEFISAVQATYTPAESAGAPPPPNSPAPDIAGAFQTDTQHATEGAL